MIPGAKELNDIAARVCRAGRPYAVEGILSAMAGGSTRYSGNIISQNVAEENVGLSIKLARSGRIGRASINQTDDASILRAVRSAAALCDAQKPLRSHLPMLGPQAYRALDGYSRETARLGPEDRARAVAAATAIVRSRDLDGAGAYESSERMVGLFNSEGLRAYHRDTQAVLSVTARAKDGGAGWAEVQTRTASVIDADAIATRAAAKALHGPPHQVRPGKYTVILEPAAVADLLSFLGYLGLGALPHLERRTALCGKLGREVFSPCIAIDDDAYHPLSCGLPFDFEGSPRAKVTLVEGGRLVGLVHDRKTATRMRTRTTGHSLPQPNVEGPLPLHLVMRPGDATLDGIIASTARGILVTQLHYTNVIDPHHLVLTGMTRNGTFLVERGKVQSPVKNLRFTQGLLEALARVRGVGRDLAACGGGFGTTVAPALAIDDFTFTSATGF